MSAAVQARPFDVGSELLVLVRHLGHVAMRIRLVNRQSPPGFFARRDSSSDPWRTIHLLADTIHNVEGLSSAIERHDFDRIIFLTELMAGVYGEQAYFGVLSNMPFTNEAIAALRSIRAKAEAAAGKVAA